MLETKQLAAGYQPNTPIVQSVNLRFEPGKIYALLGPNGCGKSTLLKTLAQLQNPLAGEVTYGGESLHTLNGKQRAQKLAMLSQKNPQPDGLTVRELVEFGRHPYTNFWGKLTAADHQIVDEVLASCQLNTLQQQQVSELSGGQAQRCWLAQALAQKSHYLLLDEPMTYLDLHHQVALMAQLRSLTHQNRTAICVLHDLNQASRYCDELIVLHQGALYAKGTPQEVMTETLFRDVFLVPAKINIDPVANTPFATLLD